MTDYDIEDLKEDLRKRFDSEGDVVVGASLRAIEKLEARAKDLETRIKQAMVPIDRIAAYDHQSAAIRALHSTEQMPEDRLRIYETALSRVTLTDIQAWAWQAAERLRPSTKERAACETCGSSNQSDIDASCADCGSP